MKKNIFLYLFIFALLINVFTYMYFTNKQKFEDGRFEKQEAVNKSLKDSLEAEKNKAGDAGYFSLMTNDNAIDYFEGQDLSTLENRIKDGIMEMNTRPGGNPLVGYDSVDGQNWMVNKVQVLNHRWIIADFNNGKAWGEVLIKYFAEPDGTFKYETIETLLYADTVK
ncbi:hypothetical protein HYN59_12790 [Flavobacterium album]|uniref:Hydrolase n=1 Tax=Flavobacterium album TaxID=2175091 RepID=A0A2S1QZT9_9FLAO|nr:hypothetical protein [Flavobacterium album]AWH85928.1 hypothetical protein HYN59_12790 [Flavobacterium album]